jgi:hypothetical protein
MARTAVVSGSTTLDETRAKSSPFRSSSPTTALLSASKADGVTRAWKPGPAPDEWRY